MAFVTIGYVRKNKWSTNVLKLLKKRRRKKCLKREHKWWFTYGDFSFWEKYHLLCSNIVPERKETTINFQAKKRRKICERNGSLQRASLP